jgi:hypothetical protein
MVAFSIIVLISVASFVSGYTLYYQIAVSANRVEEMSDIIMLKNTRLGIVPSVSSPVFGPPRLM